YPSRRGPPPGRRRARAAISKVSNGSCFPPVALLGQRAVPVRGERRRASRGTGRPARRFAETGLACTARQSFSSGDGPRFVVAGARCRRTGPMYHHPPGGGNRPCTAASAIRFRGAEDGPRVGGVLFDHAQAAVVAAHVPVADRKSTRLNSSHVKISYAVFCLKKKRTA